MSSIFAGSFFKNGPFTSFSVITYSVMTGALLVPASIVQISGVSGLSGAKPLASAKALRAFCAFSPSLPSISPGENRARSSRTPAFTMTGSILSAAAGFERNSALLMVAASSLAAVAGNTSQPETTAVTSRRITRPPSTKVLRATKFGLASSPTGETVSELRRPLHRRFLDRLLGNAEIVRGVDQRDMGQGLREIAGLTPLARVEFLRQQPKIVGNADHAVEQRLRFRDLAGQHISVGEPEAAGEKCAFERLPLIRDLAGACRNTNSARLMLGLIGSVVGPKPG